MLSNFSFLCENRQNHYFWRQIILATSCRFAHGLPVAHSKLRLCNILDAHKNGAQNNAAKCKWYRTLGWMQRQANKAVIIITIIIIIALRDNTCVLCKRHRGIILAIIHFVRLKLSVWTCSQIHCTKVVSSHSCSYIHTYYYCLAVQRLLNCIKCN